MAATVDGSSPIRFTGTPASPSGTAVSASFTPPNNALLVACFGGDGANADAHAYTFATAGLVWTEQVRRAWGETTDGGAASIWTAPQTTSAARILTVTHTAGVNAHRISIKVYVVTDVDLTGTPVDTVTASNEGGSTTNNLTTTSITPGASGLLFVAATDWTAGGGAAYEAPADGSTQDTAYYAGAISVVSGHRVASVGVALGMNLNAGGVAAAQHKWCQIVVRDAAGGVVEPSAFTLPNDSTHRPAAFRPGLAR